VWSSPPTGPAPCLVMSAQGAGGDSLTTCAPVCPWLPGWNHQTQPPGAILVLYVLHIFHTTFLMPDLVLSMNIKLPANSHKL
jgi:hypothetical protein